MELDPATIAPQNVYKLLIGCVVPRPIAWVSTVGADGVHNLAPFSFFNAVCNEPPIVMFSSGPRDGHTKDTVRNLEHTGDFVVNVVDDALAEAMNLSSGEYPSEVDEFALAGLTAVAGVKVRSPRVGEAPIAMECRVSQILHIGHGPHSVVLGQIVHFHVRDDVYEARTGRIDLRRLRPVGRLAGDLYTRVHDLFEMKRPASNYPG